ncbi:hypothetical protein U9M48_037523 [Paspalum notatum var. saurae]|uniref:Uncharacterized protein n=1 Tax=Paspalum notatum var. saurae TaxID=547442 RepID=A0AAQ3UFS2_PASNO
MFFSIRQKCLLYFCLMVLIFLPSDIVYFAYWITLFLPVCKFCCAIFSSLLREASMVLADVYVCEHESVSLPKIGKVDRWVHIFLEKWVCVL